MRAWLYIATALAAGALASGAEARSYSAAAIERMNARLAPIAADIEVASARLCRELGKRDCDVHILLDPTEHGINAHADGRNIVVNPAMMEFAKSDTHLAFVLAHESAHQFMGHVAAQREARSLLFLNRMDGMPTPGAGLAAYEQQADYIGLYVLANAGYKIDKVSDFWGQLSRLQPGDGNRSHPSNPSRSHAMQKTIAEIHAKQRERIALLPDVI